MEIKVLGTGCAKCKKLEEMAKQVVTDLGMDAQVEKEEDIYKIMQYGVMRTPALVINGKVMLSGRLPDRDELKNLLTQ